MARWLSVVAVPVGTQVRFPVPTSPVTQAPRGLTPYSGLHLHSCIHTQTQFENNKHFEVRKNLNIFSGTDAE